ncbi:hypothetical protein SCOR_34055 [Sulfidibacter corallicola]
MAAYENPTQSIRHTRVLLEIVFPLPRTYVWHAFTQKMSDWMPKDFYILSTSQKMVFQTRVGGQVYETGDRGESFTWFQVAALVPQKHVSLVGHLFPSWGGPGVSFITIDLTEAGSGCKFQLDDQVLGHIVQGTEVIWKIGWEELLSKHFSNYLKNDQSQGDKDLLL